jgi:hypothetical protein
VSSIELPFDEGVTMAAVGFAPQGRRPAVGRRDGGGARRAGARRAGARRAGVRLTRRGRLALLALLLVLTGLVAVLLAASTGEAATPAGSAPTVVVQPGDTLWSIAARYAPGPDPFGTIERIRQVNGLDGYTVHAGQRLVLPPRRG